jgi:hypothetical protein
LVRLSRLVRKVERGRTRQVTLTSVENLGQSQRQLGLPPRYRHTRIWLLRSNIRHDSAACQFSTWLPRGTSRVCQWQCHHCSARVRVRPSSHPFEVRVAGGFVLFLWGFFLPASGSRHIIGGVLPVAASLREDNARPGSTGPGTEARADLSHRDWHAPEPSDTHADANVYPTMLVPRQTSHRAHTLAGPGICNDRLAPRWWPRDVVESS